MNNGGRSPRPDEPDIRLSVELAGVRVYFAACLTAALVFVCGRPPPRHCRRLSRPLCRIAPPA